MYHKVTILGRLGRDVESRFTPDGVQVSSFPVAVNSGYGDKKKTIWWRVTTWRKTAELCNEYLSKGSRVLLEGTMQFDEQTGGPRIFERNDGTSGASFEMTASVVQFLDSRNEQAGEQPAADDDIPF